MSTADNQSVDYLRVVLRAQAVIVGQASHDALSAATGAAVDLDTLRKSLDADDPSLAIVDRLEENISRIIELTNKAWKTCGAE